LARLLGERPGLAVRVLEGPAPRLLEALRAGEIDLALTVGAATGEAAGVALEPLLLSPVVLLVPAGERIGREVTIERLRGRRLVTLQRGSGFRRHVEDAFASAGVPFVPAVEVGNLSLVRRFVAAGLGVGPVPAIAFGKPGGRRLRGIPPVPYAFARRAGISPTPAAARFIELLRR
jgi:DNA-binding transcriptional LysR family regulator